MRFFTGHPKFLFIFAFGALWNTFSYYGTQTVLVLYLMHVFLLDRSNSYLFYGAYSAFLFALPMLGGVFADKWLGYKRAIIFGSVFNIIGNLLLFTMHRYLFSLGIATALIGSGFYSSNVSNLVGALYADGDAKKETAYTFYYLSINLGGALAPLVYGAVIYFIGWHWIFLSNVLAIGISLQLFLANSKKLPQVALKKFLIKKSKLFLVGVSVLLITFLISLIFYYFSAINLVISVLFAVSIAYVCMIIFKRTGKIRAHLLTLLALSFFSTFYYAAGLQVGTTITLFLQEKIHDGIISFHLDLATLNRTHRLE